MMRHTMTSGSVRHCLCWRVAGCKVLSSLLTVLACLCLVQDAAHAQTGNAAITVTYVYTNAQRTPLAKADAQGNIIARYTYRPYGTQQSGPTNSGPGYTGHVHDLSTDLVYMQQRYYDPEVGRFLSPDPVAPTPGNIFNIGRYTYANDNPIRYTDPDGRQAFPGDHPFRQSMQTASAVQELGVPTVQNIRAEATIQGLKETAPFVPIVGDVSNVLSAINNPTIVTVTAAIIGAIPEGGTIGSDAIKGAAKAFSKEKRALVDMAKLDKKSGSITSGDMQAYKDLNKELPDPFPSNKVRGPEAHLPRTPNSRPGPGQQPHGHVGPVSHIPIRDW